MIKAAVLFWVGLMLVLVVSPWDHALIIAISQTIALAGYLLALKLSGHPVD